MKKIINFFENNYIIFLVYAHLGWVYEELWYLIAENKIVNRGFLYGPFLPVYGFGILILLIFIRRIIQKKHYLNSNIAIPTILFIVNFIYITIIEYTHERIYSIVEYISKYGLLELIISIITVIVFLILRKHVKKTKIDLTPALVFITIFIIATIVEYIAHYILDTQFNIILWNYSKDFLNINKRVCFDASRNFAILGTIAIYFIQPLIDKVTNKIKEKPKHILTLVFLIPMLIDLIISIVK